MSKIRILRELVTKTLTDIDVNAYYDYAPNNTPFPYSTFILEEVQSYEGFTQYELEINVYDNNFDSIVVDDMVDAIQKALNYKQEVVECFSISFHKSITNVVDTQSDKLQRRSCTFEVSVIGED